MAYSTTFSKEEFYLEEYNAVMPTDVSEHVANRKLKGSRHPH
jgi:hypothetical protein